MKEYSIKEGAAGEEKTFAWRSPFSDRQRKNFSPFLAEEQKNKRSHDPLFVSQAYLAWVWIKGSRTFACFVQIPRFFHSFAILTLVPSLILLPFDILAEMERIILVLVKRALLGIPVLLSLSISWVKPAARTFLRPFLYLQKEKKSRLVGKLLTSPLDFPKLIYKGRKVRFISQMIRSDLSSKTFRVFLFHLVSKERKFRKKSPKIRAIPNLANPVPISPA